MFIGATGCTNIHVVSLPAQLVFWGQKLVLMLLKTAGGRVALLAELSRCDVQEGGRGQGAHVVWLGGATPEMAAIGTTGTTLLGINECCIG